MVSAATPGEVAPPLSDPAGHGTTQAGAYTNDTLMRLVAGSQSGAARAPALPMPAPGGPDAARPAPLPLGAAAPALTARGVRAADEPVDTADGDDRTPVGVVAPGAAVAAAAAGASPDGDIAASATTDDGAGSRTA